MLTPTSLKARSHHLHHLRPMAAFGPAINFHSGLPKMRVAIHDIDEAILGSIQSLANGTAALENTLGEVNERILGLPGQLATEIDLHISPIRIELDKIKRDTIRDLEEYKAIIKEKDAFIGENSIFLMKSIEVQGTFDSLSGQVDSLSKRISVVESSITKAWDRGITVIMAVIAIVSVLIAIFRR